MAKVMASARLDEELVAAAKELAGKRGMSFAAVVDRALRVFLEDSRTGVPDLDPPRVPELDSAETTAAKLATIQARPRAGRSLSAHEAMMRERQARLNRGRS
jgi:hypothetical protein